jgi:RHS repeat-associated protein
LVRDALGSLRAATLNERRADYDALPLAWASQEVDPDTGLSHYHFREYSPSLGGWLTRDPIGLAGGYLNLRSYLGNRPSDALDVWGEAGAGDIPADGDWSRSSYWTRGFSRDYDYKAAEALIRQVEGNDGIKTAAQLYAEDRETWQGRLTQWICGSTPETFEHMARLRNIDHAEDLLHQLRDQEGYRRFSRQAAVSQVTQPIEAMVSAPIWSIPGPGRVAGAQQFAAGASTRGNTVVQGKARLLKMQAEVKCPPCKEGTTALSTYRQTSPGETYFHYGQLKDAPKFEAGLRPGGFATTAGGLTGAEAKSGLALPHTDPPNAVYVVMPQPGTMIRINPRTAPKYGQFGGLPEVEFPLGTGSGTVSGPQSIPK